MSDGIRDSSNGLQAYLFGTHGKLPKKEYIDSEPSATDNLLIHRGRLEQLEKDAEIGAAVKPWLPLICVLLEDEVRPTGFRFKKFDVAADALEALAPFLKE